MHTLGVTAVVMSDPESVRKWKAAAPGRIIMGTGFTSFGLWVMHAGYPMIDNLLTLLQANSHVYVDVAGLIWSYPRREVDTYIQRIVEGGFGDRVMFGTDQLVWPKLMETSIEVIDRASYLTPQQKRAILYDNAARFLRLDRAGAPRPREPARQ